MPEGQLLMTQAERDRLVALKKAKKKLMYTEGGSRGGGARSAGTPPEPQDQCGYRRGGGGDPVTAGVPEIWPTLAAEYLAKKHAIEASRETVRRWMMEAKLWRGRKQHVEEIYEWRPRRSRMGELVQWDTSNHDWLEGRGEEILLINMIDDATSRWFARFVTSDSTVENMNLLERYVKKHGRPLGYYTDKASLFQTAVKTRRDGSRAGKEREELPPTQIGRALQELGIVWIAAHSPQAKGRVERGFLTAQDRLVKGMRVAGVKTLEQANHYLETEFLPW